MTTKDLERLYEIAMSANPAGVEFVIVVNSKDMNDLVQEFKQVCTISDGVGRPDDELRFCGIRVVKAPAGWRVDAKPAAMAVSTYESLRDRHPHNFINDVQGVVRAMCRPSPMGPDPGSIVSRYDRALGSVGHPEFVVYDGDFGILSGSPKDGDWTTITFGDRRVTTVYMEKFSDGQWMSKYYNESFPALCPKLD